MRKDLETEISLGRFRSDLFFRLQVIEIVLPPLRARGSDLLLLANHLVARICVRMERPKLTLPPAFIQALMAYDWPGNVRELNNAMERAVALATSDQLSVTDLPDRVRTREVRPARATPDELVTAEEAERRHVLRVLEAVGGNKKAAAEVLQMDRSTLYRKLDRWVVQPTRPRA